MFGGVWPVVQREMRAAARWPLGGWLRVGGALCGVLVLCSIWDIATLNGMGMNLFTDIHILLLWMVCILAPALTADCLARERREGTLGLLFLTSLTANGIVVGKSVAQVLRVLMLWMALLPVLALPFLVGGVTWADVVYCLLAELCCGLLCLAAGILASSLTDSRSLAFLLAFMLMGLFMGAPVQYRVSALQNPFGQGFSRAGNLSPVMSQFRAGIFPYPAAGRVIKVAAKPGAIGTFVRREAGRLFTAAIVLWIALRIAGWRVEQSWQDKPPSVRVQRLAKRYCTPISKDWFARRMRAIKEKNPIAWLQQYSWKARAGQWGLCLLFVILDCWCLDSSSLPDIQHMLWVLMLIMAAAYVFAGVNGFYQEKRSGALELILVSPISIENLIIGRSWGLVRRFFPSVLVVVGSNLVFYEIVIQDGGGYYPMNGDTLFSTAIIETVAIYLTLPVVATCFALTARNLIIASTLTVVVIFLPAAFAFLLPSASAPRMIFIFPALLAHGISATMAYHHVLGRLRHRRYAY